MRTHDKEEDSHLARLTFVRDVIIGMADGITVPFAIAAGLASTGIATSTIVITAMLAEIAAGSISMGLGGFLAAQTEAEHYAIVYGKEQAVITGFFRQPVKSALTISGSYIVGGAIPLLPYLFVRSTSEALILSVAITLVALLIFGFLRGVAIGSKPWKSMWQTLLIGGVAAGTAFLVAKLV